ncbi:MAG TPA: HEAT repeat domain-containing protein, partial [Acidobacteriaceae bacterium]|nr:HEAT repeat domain-containing protein [Acidobacteriaceae bacterium]
GEIGDGSDVDLLLDKAREHSPDSYNRELAIESAGKAGGAAAIPALVAELSNPSLDTEQDAVRALYLTGSREAVPVLITLLRSPEWRVSSTAEFGLEVITHGSGASRNEMKPPPPEAYAKWVRWWTQNGGTATIFKSDKCGTIEPLTGP